MGKKLFLAADLGTSFIKTGVYDLDGVCLSTWSEPVQGEQPAPGVFLQRGEVLYQAVLRCIRRCVQAIAERSNEIEALAFTGQMAGAMGVDGAWGDVTTWSCSLDTRYVPYANRQRESLNQAFYDISGTNAPVMCAKYAWFQHEFPEKHPRISKYVMLNGYMIGRLSGMPALEAKIDNSLIAWTGLADIRRGTWSEELVQAIGFDRALLPEIVDCTAICGALSPKSAKELGLRAGLPLVAGAGDKVSGCVGANILTYGAKIFEAASYGAFSALVPEARLDMERRSYDLIGGISRGDFYVHKYIQGSGITIDWFLNAFVRKQGETSGQAFSRIEWLAQQAGLGSDGMLTIGLLGGSAIPFNSDLRGLFMGHSWGHTEGHFYRSMLESFGYELALTLDAFTRNYPQYASGTIKMIGGGAKSRIWGQILADITGRGFEVLERGDSALWGCALLAAAATGAVSDLKALAAEHARCKQMFCPEEKAFVRYQPYVALYREACSSLGGLFAQLHGLTNGE